MAKVFLKHYTLNNKQMSLTESEVDSVEEAMQFHQSIPREKQTFNQVEILVTNHLKNISSRYISPFGCCALYEMAPACVNLPKPVTINEPKDSVKPVYFWVSMNGTSSEALLKTDELNNLIVVATYDEADDESADVIDHMRAKAEEKYTVNNITLDSYQVYEICKTKHPELTFDDMGAICLVEAARHIFLYDKMPLLAHE